ncbi:MAG: site-specific DNA-methyltransferase [Ruminococcaceae bacterium]|nr:site-specific DNA-methyltransferase [Oscillospiraceae bacterium]
MNNVQNGIYSLKENKFLAYGEAHSENLLIHGDSLIVLELLKEKYGGEINCIYMDPPYCSGTKNEHYTDIFCQEEYFKMMKDIFSLAFEILSDKGFLLVQMGFEHAYSIRGLIESVFSNDNFRNEIIVKRDDHKIYADTIHHLASGYDLIFLFSKNPDTMLPALRKCVDKGEKRGYWKDLYRSTSCPQQQYPLCGIYPHSGEWRWAEQKAIQALQNYKQISDYAAKQHWNIVREFDYIYEWYVQNESDMDEFPILRKKNSKIEFYIPPSDEVYITDNWFDLIVRGTLTNFEHEVNKEIIRRIIGWLTKEGDFLLDPFLGSGTSAVVASEMNRRWIGIEKEQYCSTDIRNRINRTIDEIHRENGTMGYRFFELNKNEQ